MSLRRILAVAGLLVAASPVLAADLPGRVVVKEPIEPKAPCADLDVLERIAERFAWAEANNWHRGFVMASIENGRFSGHPFFEPGLVKRDYCRADSVMTNGRRHAVYFAIEYDQGFASLGNYVDFCVQGLDPWHVHDEACRTVR